MNGKKNSKIGLPQVRHLQTRDFFAATPSWKIKNRRYKSFKKACEIKGITMIAAINNILDDQIAETFGYWYLEKMLEDIKKEAQDSPARNVGRPKKPH